ncbi:gp436 family protein [Paracoccus sp. IB05]|uniref:gp436 family protein n=1 Tax=Paracoccus sp. IB05 TaxID=2779367 RepID=UPI0018E8CD65|nr:DUF1320 domain-containing protein [Paracoccus sp. IB05]MBJ2150608.1 DUF1320 domain-containing protein [Paracoccus sp. IB05]
MSYATVQNLIDRYGEHLLVMLTDHADPPSGVIDGATVARALNGADDLINGFLGAYQLPLTAVPELVTKLAEVIAIYDLHVTSPEEKIQKDYDNALKRLAEISKGTIQLKDAAGIEPAAPQGSGVQITDRERAFTPESMTGFI